MIDLAKKWFLFFILKYLFKDKFRYVPVRKKTDVKPSTIWVFWEQGIDNAPEIVKMCVASIKKYNETRDVVLLSQEEIADYVQIPEFIVEKHKKGIISRTHYSDVIRLLLLRTYGGYWIDSTCLFTGKMPEEVTNSPFFMFERTLVSPAKEPILMSNWFIKSDAQNPLLSKTTDVLLGWWKFHNLHISYYLFHIIMTTIVWTDSKSKKIWDDKVYICNMQPHILQFSFCRKFDFANFEFILSQSFIHKLTYKLNADLMKEKENEENVLQHLLKKYAENVSFR